MWKFCAIVFVAISFSRYASAQTGQKTLASTQYSMQKIVNDLIYQENRIKAAIATDLAKIDTAINDLKSVAAASAIVTALQNAKAFLINAATVNDYGQPNVTLSCSNIPAISASIQFNIQTCYGINYMTAGNSTWLMTYYAQINAAFQLQGSLTATQKQEVQAVLTALMSNRNEYVQYTAALVTAVYQYSVIYADLLFCKKNFCSCPSNLPSSGATTMATIDTTISTVQTSISAIEAKIRKDASTLASQIASANADLKKNADFVSISTTLDTLASLVSGYLSINTYTASNATVTCDDAAMTTALVQYKLAQYFKTNIEAATNASYVIVQLGLLNAYTYSTKYASLSATQKASIEAVKTSINDLLADFRQYILALITGWGRLLPLPYQAQTANKGCSCSSGGGGSDTSTAAPTSM